MGPRLREDDVVGREDDVVGACIFERFVDILEEEDVETRLPSGP